MYIALVNLWKLSINKGEIIRIYSADTLYKDREIHPSVKDLQFMTRRVMDVADS